MRALILTLTVSEKIIQDDFVDLHPFLHNIPDFKDVNFVNERNFQRSRKQVRAEASDNGATHLFMEMVSAHALTAGRWRPSRRGRGGAPDKFSEANGSRRYQTTRLARRRHCLARVRWLHVRIVGLGLADPTHSLDPRALVASMLMLLAMQLRRIPEDTPAWAFPVPMRELPEANYPRIPRLGPLRYQCGHSRKSYPRIPRLGPRRYPCGHSRRNAMNRCSTPPSLLSIRRATALATRAA